MELLLAIIIGLLFGFALNRAGATNPENIINMLRLKDLRLMKTILFAIGTASILLFLGLWLGFVNPAHISIQNTYLGIFIGGALLGIGFAIAGYCPGTGLAALATGRKDALWFVIGALLGAFIYTVSYSWLVTNTFLFSKMALGSLTLAFTGNEKYSSLLGGHIVGVLLGLVFVIISFILPSTVRTNPKKTSHYNRNQKPQLHARHPKRPENRH